MPGEAIAEVIAEVVGGIFDILGESKNPKGFIIFLIIIIIVGVLIWYFNT